MMELHALLAEDHERLDELLAEIVRGDGTIDEEAYNEFRQGLLRHIGIEERILLPEVRKRRGVTPLDEQLHRDHAALSALLVPPPTVAEVELIRGILAQHNPLEESAGCFYDIVEEVMGDELYDVVTKVLSFPEVRLAPHADNEVVRRSIDQLVRQAEEGRPGEGR